MVSLGATHPRSTAFRLRRAHLTVAVRACTRGSATRRTREHKQQSCLVLACTRFKSFAHKHCSAYARTLKRVREGEHVLAFGASHSARTRPARRQRRKRFALCASARLNRITHKQQAALCVIRLNARAQCALVLRDERVPNSM